MDERTCADCAVDISERHHNAKRCTSCARRQSARVQRERPKRVRSPKLDRSLRRCLACGTSFEPGRATQVTCSNRCYMWVAKHGATPREQERTCPTCDTVFAPATQAQKYCDPRCRAAASKRRTRNIAAPFVRLLECAVCGGPMPPDARAGRRYCSEKCGLRNKRAERIAMEEIGERECVRCRAAFQPKNRRHVTCSPECSRMWHYEQNRALYSARAMAWMTEHRDLVQERAKRRRDANIEDFRQRERAYYEANRDRFTISLQKRRSAKANNRDSVGIAYRDWQRLVARQRNLCAYCSQWTSEFHMEHIIPLSRGGRHAIGNVIPVCPNCNLSKHDKLLIEWRYVRKRGGLSGLNRRSPAPARQPEVA